MFQYEFMLGIEYSTAPDLQACLSEAITANFSFIITPIIHPRFRLLPLTHDDLRTAVTRSDTAIKPRDWTKRLVGRLSPYVNVDVTSGIVRQRYEDYMMEELAYCKSLGILAVLVTIKNSITYNLARIIMAYESSPNPPAIWAHITIRLSRVYISVPSSANGAGGSASANAASIAAMKEQRAWNEPWNYWSKFHERLAWNKNVGIVIELAKEIPPPEILKRWLGEPVKAIVVPTSLFIEEMGLPVLSEAHQQLIMSFAQLHVQLIVRGARKHDVASYSDFLLRIQGRLTPRPNGLMMAPARRWENSVQLPLQPLADNLDAETYGIFEEDPTKYIKYQKAIVKAMNYISIAKLTESRGPSPNEPGPSTRKEGGAGSSAEDITLTVMVLGAGRGPLVRATFNAADLTNSRVKVIAVEKNPCAIIALTAQARQLWSDRNLVTIEGDMRHLKFDEKADIIVSELLGSWGDNELAPECLDGALGYLNPGGIMIPTEYTSHVAPISSPRLWTAAKNANNGNTMNQFEKNLETLWVVHMINKFSIGESKPVFTFRHPAECAVDCEGNSIKDFRGNPVSNNRRTASIKWEVTHDSVLHGFGGYFDCRLYDNETISIVPSTHTEGLTTWCPVYIPIKTPIRVHPGDVIRAMFWRCIDRRRVWYEWIVEVGNRTTSIHNSNGCSSEMLL